MSAHIETVTEHFEAVKKASRNLLQFTEQEVNELLKSLAKSLIENADQILKENQKDLDKMLVTDAKYDRLQLTHERINAIAQEIDNVAALPSPLGRIIEERTMENGMHISKITAPIGVVGIIYEARPNVTCDVFSLCIKSGNACILKGGSDAEFSNKSIVRIIQSVLKQHHFPENCIALLPPTRDAATALLHAVGIVDVIIPRGSMQLINYVRENSKVPVIETGAGIVHAYFDESGDVEKGKAIIYNSKTRRVSVCNALDCLLIHANCLNYLNELTKELANENVIIYADAQAYLTLENSYPQQLLFKATEAHYGTEFLDYKMAIKTVDSIEEAINHITKFGSKHSETIITESQKKIEQFLNEVDAAVVYANVSTAFTDGGQFGLGAEIGISTQKLHARGPMGLAELCSYKWLVKGNGQVRN